MNLTLDNKERKELLSFLPKEHRLYKKIEKSLRKIKPRSAKNKGLAYQKAICEVISSLINIPCGQDDDSLISSRTSGLNGTDIILRGEAAARFPYSVECKDCSSVSLPQWVEQAQDNSTESRPYLLFIRSPKIAGRDCVVMALETFKTILRKSK